MRHDEQPGDYGLSGPEPDQSDKAPEGVAPERNLLRRCRNEDAPQLPSEVFQAIWVFENAIGLSQGLDDLLLVVANLDAFDRPPSSPSGNNKLWQSCFLS